VPDQLPLFAATGLVARARRSTDQAVTALRKLGRVEPVDVGQVALLRTLADLMDAEMRSPERSAWTMARLAAEWRATWGELTGRTASGFDDAIAAFFAGGEDPTAAGPPAPLRDPPQP
jgi:hypothetical protein